MKFSGINQEAYITNVLTPYQKEANYAKKIKIVAIMSIIIGIPSFLLAFNLPMDNRLLFALVAAICTAIFMFSLTSLTRCTIVMGRYITHLNLEKRQIVIEVLPNLHIQVYERGVLKATIKRVESMFLNDLTYTYVIKGDISRRGRLVNEYEISMAILDIEQLISYLQINKHMRNNLKFQNQTLKSIMHMDEEARKKLFIKELADASFLVFGVLSENNILKNGTISISQDITLELANNQESFYVYTSGKEVPKELIKTYPIPYVISLKNLCAKIQTSNPLEVFKEQKSLGIIINSNNEHLCISNEQLTKIFQSQGEENKHDI